MPVRTALHSLLGGGVSGGQASEPSSAAPHRLHDCLSPPPPPPWNHSLPGNRSLLPNRWGTAELEDIRDSVIAFQKCGGGAGKRYIWILYVRNKTYGPTDNLSPSYPCLKGSLFFLPPRSFMELIWETVREIKSPQMARLVFMRGDERGSSG